MQLRVCEVRLYKADHQNGLIPRYFFLIRPVSHSALVIVIFSFHYIILGFNISAGERAEVPIESYISDPFC